LKKKLVVNVLSQNVFFFIANAFQRMLCATKVVLAISAETI